ncbi:monooxygenase domain-containing protein [Isoalcanivorax pacificus W11-5]|uniref:Monooxygenase domain-containing protein n=1 Tax=Isoalcanivorax pacificus W11-5 TaxID=391936 RepID=A0A0B4XRP5_9GAMM|nr:NAD(P)/FAD-dependent oxidoreductase [Isoalcanivorax pacificus]AJD49871.1 monooxygenase domain-containing protein [Isoalcanivorax pacificus W11-5]
MYALIGAGPMGLATARNLDKQGIAFTGFELNDDVGGLWDIDNPHSTMYETAHLISSKTMTEFAEFPMRDDVAPYPRHDAMRAYFRDYARHFDLYRRFEFNTRVLSVEPDGAGWLVTSERDGVTRTRRFHGVLIANGTLHHPNIPTLPGDFAGRVMHSSEYRSPEVFRDQRVLVVGCGNSGADIAVDAVHHARSVDLSVRRGYYFLPKFLLGRPTDTLGKLKLPRRLKQWADSLLIKLVMGKPSSYGLPDPDYRMYESHPVMNSLILHHLGHGDIQARRDIARIDGHRVCFTDGSEGEYDIILLATGYKLHYPFIDRKHLNWPQGAGAPQLYLNVFHPDYDNLFMMGMIEAAGLGWEGRNEQAEMAALYIRQLANGSPAALRLKETKRREAGNVMDGGYDYLKLERMAYYVHKDSYRKAVLAQIRAMREEQHSLARARQRVAGAR